MSESEDKRGPGLKFPPPLLVLAIIGCAYLIERLFSLPIVAGEFLWLTGTALIVAALLLATITLLHFFKAKTHVEPWHPTTTIIQKGVFRYSRNPIYLSFCIATLGIGVILNSWWVVCSLLPTIYFLQHLVIKREEAYLEHKFGAPYLDYKQRVRRWI
ncbi:MAG: isoprenylcysteine carboxylmethyltransferase family protein [Gammaproteobacteria bacterium]|nr:isoprenylcysteine carboxylmethyltransferase family protein [Gammaproteobacteria bacterium]